MKQKFKGEILTSKKVVNSILRFYQEASAKEVKEGMNWYNDANQYCRELSGRFNLPIQCIAGIIAAYSPQTGWLENKRFAVSFLIAPKGRYKSLVEDMKARKIAGLKCENEIYQALSIADAAFKTKAFFLNILNPDLVTDVTIDRHAIATCIQRTENVAALDNSYGKLTKAQYDFFQKCYVLAAKELDILPQQLQAIVWTVYRRLRELRQYKDSLSHWKPFDNSSSNPF